MLNKIVLRHQPAKLEVNIGRAVQFVVPTIFSQNIGMQNASNPIIIIIKLWIFFIKSPDLSRVVQALPSPHEG